MAVKIGSARIDENGKAHGGQAGDQTGKEVSTQNWYLHSKGWRVFRAKNPSVAEKIREWSRMPITTRAPPRISRNSSVLKSSITSAFTPASRRRSAVRVQISLS